MRLASLFFSLLLVSLAASAQTSAPSRPPIIDMHLHAFPADFWGGKAGPPNPVTGKPSAAATDEAILQASLTAMERYHIVKAVTSGPLGVVERWKSAAPNRIIGSPLFPHLAPNPDLARLKSDYLAGRLGALGEITAQYAGLTLASPEFEPYLALAEELDIPVALHTGLGPPGATYDCCPRFRAELGNPLLIEEALVRHPKLRVYIMHAGHPFLEETIALLHAHPQVYADVAVIDWIAPREEFHNYLRALMQHTDCGLPKRLMFGSDQMVWPEAIGMAIEGIESANFLTKEQKRDIFCGNAARFLRLEPSLCQ